MGFYTFLQKSLSPLIYANFVLMVLAGGFLLYSNITFIWPPVLGLLASPMAFPFLMLPAGLCAGLMQVFHQAKPGLSRFFAVASIVYLALMLSGYLWLSFKFLMPFFTEGPVRAAAVIYAVSAAIAPWALFAARDRGNVMFTGMVMMMQATGILLGALVISGVSLGALWLFLCAAAAMLAMVGAQAFCENVLLSRRKD